MIKNVTCLLALLVIFTGCGIIDTSDNTDTTSKEKKSTEKTSSREDSTTKTNSSDTKESSSADTVADTSTIDTANTNDSTVDTSNTDTVNNDASDTDVTDPYYTSTDTSPESSVAINSDTKSPEPITSCPQASSYIKSKTTDKFSDSVKFTVYEHSHSLYYVMPNEGSGGFALSNDGTYDYTQVFPDLGTPCYSDDDNSTPSTSSTGKSTVDASSTKKSTSDSSSTDTSSTPNNSNILNSYSVIDEDKEISDTCLELAQDFSKSHQELKNKYFVLRYDYKFYQMVIYDSGDPNTSKIDSVWEKYGEDDFIKEELPGNAYHEPCLKGQF